MRNALAIDPQVQMASLDSAYPDVARVLARERITLMSQSPESFTAPRVYDCLGKCPEGVRPPRFTFFPNMTFLNADVGLYDRRMRTYVTFEAVIGADGVLEPPSLVFTGGTARNTEQTIRRAFTQARFDPGELNGEPVRTRVRLRFDFSAEGMSWIRYSYQIVAR